MHGQWVGAMRMVFKNDQLLPLEKHCALTAQISNNHLNRSIEISRLCLIKSIRKRGVDYINTLALADEKKPAKDDNVIPFHRRKHLERSIIWGLIRAGALHCEKHNIQSHLQNYQPENSASQYQLPKSHFFNRVERESLFLAHDPIIS